MKKFFTHTHPEDDFFQDGPGREGPQPLWLNLGIAGVFIAFLCAIILLVLLGASSLRAHDDDHQMGIDDPGIRAWYSNLKQPDNGISCCGLADAWWADSFGVDEKGDGYAIITDTRPDELLGRRHIENGSKFIVPHHKYNKDNNPTGHGVIFIDQDGRVLCYIIPGGV